MEIAVEEEEEDVKNTKGVWIRMRDALDKALMDYRKARIAVMRAIEEVFYHWYGGLK